MALPEPTSFDFSGRSNTNSYLLGKSVFADEILGCCSCLPVARTWYKGEVGMTLHGQTKYVTRKEILGVLRTKVGVGLAKNLYPNHM